MIYANVELTVEDRKTVANKNIVLYRGDANVEIRFMIKDNRFVVLESTRAQMIIRRPSTASIFSEIVPIENNTVIFKITAEMIDELKEIGEYTFQIRLYDDEMNARATLPPCNSCLYIEKPIAIEGESAINYAYINNNVTVMSDDIEETFNANGEYNATIWEDGMLISDAKMNKIEDAIYSINEANYEVEKKVNTTINTMNTSINKMKNDITSIKQVNTSQDTRMSVIEDSINTINETNASQDELIEWLKVNGGGGGGGGGSTTANLTSETLSDISVETGKDATITYRFTSPNIGDGTLKVFVNDVESISRITSQGEGEVVILNTSLTKGENKITMYVIDRANIFTNVLTFTITYGSIEITSTFDNEQTYEVGSTIRFYFTPKALSALDVLTFHMEIDGKEYTMSCVNNTRTTYTFPKDLTVGSHNCRAWITNEKGSISNILAFSLVILDATTLVISSAISEATAEEGYQVVLDYKVSMQGYNTFNTFFYVNGTQVNTGTATLVRNYWSISTLTEGTHTLKIVAETPDGLNSAEYTWTVVITASTYMAVKPVTAGLDGNWTAYELSNTSSTRNIWKGENEDGDVLEGILYNYNFGSNSGWIEDGLLSTGDAYAMLPIKPLQNNAQYGYTFDIEFYSTNIGNEEATVVKCWDDENDCGFKITTAHAILRSKAGNELNVNFTDTENTAITFVIDRENKQAIVYLNGIITQAFYLSDYTTDSGQKVLEDFSVNDYIYIGNVDYVGWNYVRNVRSYQIALTKEEVLQNYISNQKNLIAQQALSLRQEGNDLPVMTITADFNGIGKDDAKKCSIRYISPNSELYGDSFELNNNSTVQWQGTSSLVYAIKNYKIKLKDDLGNKFKYNPYNDGAKESTFCLKADYMESSHAHNTGLAKFINKYLYDGLSLNPARQVNPKIRDTINGFPIKLVLRNTATINDGISSSEPLPGETKDMGIFNFNLDKGCTDSLGFDTDVYPHCKSYEVTANSDKSAGAFVAYGGKVFSPTGGALLVYTSSLGGNNEWNGYGFSSQYIPVTGGTKFEYYPTEISNANTEMLQYYGTDNVRKTTISKNSTVTLDAQTKYVRFNYWVRDVSMPSTLTINGKTYDVKVVTDPNLVNQPYNTSYGGVTNGDITGEWVDANNTGETYNPDDELAYIKDSFELRYPDEDDYGSDYGFMDTEYGLKRLIDKIDAWDVTTDEGIEQMRAEFEDYMDLGYTLRYLLCTLVFAQVDNLGKNMMITTWDGKIWYPQFYDLDTCLSLNNSGQIKIGVDAEIEQGTFNTSNSNLWLKLRVAFDSELKEQYRQMRSGKFNIANIMEFLYGEQISKIPESYYNKDAQIKYLDFENQYLDKLHGNQYEHMKQWLTDRLLYVDTLMDYTSTTDDAITVRANTLNMISFNISTYTPQYLRIKWKNGVVEKKKIDGKNPTLFEGKVDAATDQEILIYNASKIKMIEGLETANPNSLDMAYATKIQKLTINNAPLLTTINGGTSGGVNLNTMTYLNYLDLKGCTKLPNAVVLNRCQLMSYVNIQDTLVNDLQLYPGSVSLKEVWYPSTIQMIALSDLPKLEVVGLQYGHSCKELKLINCPSINSFGNKEWSNSTLKYKYPDGYFLGGVKKLYLDNSYDVEELAILGSEAIEELSLYNLNNLKEVTLSERIAVEKFVTDTANSYNNTYYPSLADAQTYGDFVLHAVRCPNLKTFNTKTNRWRRDWFNDYTMGNINLIKEKAIAGTSAMQDTRFYQTGFHCNRCDLSDSPIENVNLFITSYIAELILPTTTKKMRINPVINYVQDTDYNRLSGDDMGGHNFSNQFGWDGQGITSSIIYSMATSVDDVELRKWKLGDIQLTDFDYPITGKSQGNMQSVITYADFTIDEAILNLKPEMYTPRLPSTVFSSISGTIDLSNFQGYSLKDALNGLTDAVTVTLPNDFSTVRYFNNMLKGINTQQFGWELFEIVNPFLYKQSEMRATFQNAILREQSSEAEGIDIHVHIDQYNLNNSVPGDTSIFYGSNLKYINSVTTTGHLHHRGLFANTNLIKIGEVNINIDTHTDAPCDGQLFYQNPSLVSVGNINITFDSSLEKGYKVTQGNSPGRVGGHNWFNGCSSLETVGDIVWSDYVDVMYNRLDGTKNIVGQTEGMFNDCQKLISVGDLSTLKPYHTGNMFYKCGLTSGRFSIKHSPNFSRTTNIRNILWDANCDTFDLSSLDGNTNLTEMYEAFLSADINNLIFPTKIPDTVTTCYRAFESSKISKCPTFSPNSLCTNITNMFRGTKFDTPPSEFRIPPKATSANSIFQDSNLSGPFILDGLGDISIGSVVRNTGITELTYNLIADFNDKDANYQFDGCGSLEKFTINHGDAGYIFKRTSGYSYVYTSSAPFTTLIGFDVNNMAFCPFYNDPKLTYVEWFGVRNSNLTLRNLINNSSYITNDKHILRLNDSCLVDLFTNHFGTGAYTLTLSSDMMTKLETLGLITVLANKGWSLAVGY